jgi:hypothetical protein
MGARNRRRIGLSYRLRAGGINSLESIPGLHKSLKIWALAKLAARVVAVAALFFRIQISLNNTKLATNSKERPTHSRPPKKSSIQKND